MGSDTVSLGGRPAALSLAPSYGHTTKFTNRRIVPLAAGIPLTVTGTRRCRR